MWHTYVGERAEGLRTGIKIVLTEAEHDSVLSGSWERVAGGKRRHASAKKKPTKRRRVLSPAAAREFRKLSRMLGKR